MHDEYYGVPSTPTSDYLAHYGVLGMKWGIRRAAKKGTTYQYKSHATKKYEKAAEKLAAKAQKKNSDKLAAKSKVMANRAKRSAEVDRGEEEFARNISTKKAVAASLLIPGGSNVMKAYAQHRAMSGGKGNNASGGKGVAAVESAWQGTAGSRLRKAGYIRQDEKKNGINAKAHRVMENARGVGASYVEPAAKAYNQNKAPAKKKKKAPSSNYMAGLKKASSRGGLIGGAVYAARHKG